jgi:hypothetical protein
MKLPARLLSLALVAAIAFPATLPTTMAAPATGEKTTRHDYPISDGIVVQLDVPDAWLGGLADKTGQRMPSILFQSNVNPRFQILVSAMPLSGAKDIEAKIRDSAVELGVQAMEGEPKIMAFAGDHGRGWYFAMADKQYADPKSVPPVGEFKYLTRGGMVFERASLVFTILTNDDSRDIDATALAMIKKSAIRQETGST